MRRLHLVELEDLPWLPAVLRDGATAYLEFVIAHSGQVDRLLPPLERVLRQTGITEIVDLCSGSGGPIRAVVETLRGKGVVVHATLTDKYPNRSAMQEAAGKSNGAITFSEASIDATRVPPNLRGVRTVFNAFHHFRPSDALGVLKNAAETRTPIALFEMVSREPLQLVGLLFAPIAAMLTVPFWRPFRWSFLLLSWVLPLVPLVILWDGIVSWLRIYGETELWELVRRIESSDFEWEIGKIRLGGPPVHAVYLVGVPKHISPNVSTAPGSASPSQGLCL